MQLSSLNLEAFVAVARQGSFTLAARTLHLTQSALSQRVLNLEADLEVTLLIRDPSGLKLTAKGEELLRFCEQQERLERELLGKIGKSVSNELTGTLRVAGFSTVMRSVVMPTLGPLLARHREVQVELLTAELRDLPGLLRSGKTDFILLDQELRTSGIQSHLLGEEKYVWVRLSGANPRAVFLDQDAEDQTTREFFRIQSDAPNTSLRRSFMGDIDSIIDGVAQGWGEAIVPRHLLHGRKDLKIVPGKNPLCSPVYLNYFEQPYYTSLQKAAIEAFLHHSPGLLRASGH
jgi:DNA-binding transcriptional LysR family regulator